MLSIPSLQRRFVGSIAPFQRGTRCKLAIVTAVALGVILLIMSCVILAGGIRGLRSKWGRGSAGFGSLLIVFAIGGCCFKKAAYVTSPGQKLARPQPDTQSKPYETIIEESGELENIVSEYLALSELNKAQTLLKKMSNDSPYKSHLLASLLGRHYKANHNEGALEVIGDVFQSHFSSVLASRDLTPTLVEKLMRGKLHTFYDQLAREAYQQGVQKNHFASGRFAEVIYLTEQLAQDHNTLERYLNL